MVFPAIRITRAVLILAGVLSLITLTGGCRTMRKVDLIAHRGASHEAPENTLAAVRLGWEKGADGVEVDVYLTADRGIVAIHDGTTKRTGGVDRPVAEQTLAELRALDVGSWKAERFAGERIPTLAEVLATAPPGGYFFIEIKCGPEIVPVLEPVVEASGLAASSVRFISFDLDACAAVKRALPEHKVFFLSGFSQDKETGEWSPTADELIRKASGANLDGLDLGFAAPVDAAMARRITDAGLEMHVWTVDDPEAARRAIEAGTLSITTNRPGYMREQLGF